MLRSYCFEPVHHQPRFGFHLDFVLCYFSWNLWTPGVNHLMLRSKVIIELETQAQLHLDLSRQDLWSHTVEKQPRRNRWLGPASYSRRRTPNHIHPPFWIAWRHQSIHHQWLSSLGSGLIESFLVPNLLLDLFWMTGAGHRGQFHFPRRSRYSRFISLALGLGSPTCL